MAELLFRDTSLQVVIEKIVTTSNRAIVVGHGHAVLLVDEPHVAAQRMEVRFLGEQRHRFVRQRECLVVFLLAKRFATFVIGIVGGFDRHRFFHHSRIAFGTEFTTGRQVLGAAPVFLYALLGRRMTRKHSTHPVLVAAFAQLYEGLLQCHCTLRVVAGPGHEAHAVFVGLEFSIATVS